MLWWLPKLRVRSTTKRVKELLTKICRAGLGRCRLNKNITSLLRHLHEKHVGYNISRHIQTCIGMIIASVSYQVGSLSYVCWFLNPRNCSYTYHKPRTIGVLLTKRAGPHPPVDPSCWRISEGPTTTGKDMKPENCGSVSVPVSSHVDNLIQHDTCG